jgi:large conductance mechanosensitive channel
MSKTKKTPQKTKPPVADHLKDQAKTHFGGFIDFIKNQSVIGLAIGLVIGTAATTLVNSLINNVVMPPLGFLLGSSQGLKGLYIDMGTTPAGDPAHLNYGMFLSDFINFLVIALVVYLVVTWLHLELKKK